MRQSKKQQSFMYVMRDVISLYLIIMLGFFPVYYKYQYADMGDAKYKLFLYSSVICVVVFFLLWLYFFFVERGMKSRQSFTKNGQIADKLELSLLDKAILIYFGVTTLSFLLSQFKEMGFRGSDGWSMGWLSQFLFVSVYFMVAKGWQYGKWAIWLLMASSTVVFLVAVFHRFDVDLLNIYGDLELYYKVLFLSTMGQSSWYSSFLCTVYPIGLYLFFISENKKVRIIAGIYSVIAMCSLVTQNTDSAFLSLAAVMLVLFYLSFDKKGICNKERISGNTMHKPFLEVIILVLGSFCFMGICQRVFADKVIPLDTMSLFMSQSVLIWILLAVAVSCYGVICYRTKMKNKTAIHKQKNKDGKEEKQVGRLLFWILLGFVAVCVIVVLTFIVLNTNGFLADTFGYQSTNNYLLFDDQWGNGRGFAWKFASGSFLEFSFLQKLIGVGPDCFSAYIKSVPKYLEQMQAFWGDLVLTNAHNEYLTKLFNLGITGLLSYVGMLGVAVWTFLKNRNENAFLPVFALCTVSYMVHNIFCYEQVCCTPFFYILLGVGSNLIHNKPSKSVY